MYEDPANDPVPPRHGVTEAWPPDDDDDGGEAPEVACANCGHGDTKHSLGAGACTVEGCDCDEMAWL